MMFFYKLDAIQQGQITEGAITNSFRSSYATITVKMYLLRHYFPLSLCLTRHNVIFRHINCFHYPPTYSLTYLLSQLTGVRITKSGRSSVSPYYSPNVPDIILQKFNCRARLMSGRTNHYCVTSYIILQSFFDTLVLQCTTPSFHDSNYLIFAFMTLYKFQEMTLAFQQTLHVSYLT